MRETMPSYFYTREEAMDAYLLLDSMFEATFPAEVGPINGRDWMIEVEPHGDSADNFTPEARSQVIHIVLQYNGQVHET